MTHTDGWSWFDAPELNDVDLTGHDVTAVLVCRNAGSWLNATLAGLGQLDRRPEVIVAVDNESTDDTPDLLRDAYRAGLVDQIVAGKARTSFGEAVERALSVVEAPTRWIWLLHDDAVPDHDALVQLLTLASRTPRLAIAVPLLVRPTRRTHAARTLEVGASISGSGRRALGLEPDEVAQGQYESTTVLGGSTCGMLVRWESLIEMGGFDRCISAYRDGVDLGWRAHLTGQWVLTCPRARLVHRQAGRSEIRHGTIAALAGRSEAAWDRLMGLRLVAAHVHGLARPFNLLYLSLVCLVNALVYLLGRAPDRAKDEVQAWSDFLWRSRKPVSRLRKKIAQVSRGRQTAGRVRLLRPTVSSVLEDAVQAVARWFHAQFALKRDAEMTLDDLLGDEFTRRIGEGRKRVPPGVWLLAGVAAVAVMARNLYAAYLSQGLAGGHAVSAGLVRASGLLGAPASLGAAFERALSELGRSEPWLLVSAAGSALTVRPGWFPVVVLALAVPAGLWAGVWYLRRRIHHTGLRWLAAAGYALLPVLVGGLNRGALWLVVCVVVLPFLAEWLSRLDLPWAGAKSLQGLAGICLSGILVMAITPALWVPVIVITVVVAIRAGGTARFILALIALGLPVGFWFAALPGLARQPVRLLLTPDPLLTPAPLAPQVSWQMLFGRPFAAGLPPLWASLAVFSVLWLGALLVFVTSRWRRPAILAALAAISVGIWVARLPLTLGSEPVHADPTPWLLVGFAVALYCLTTWLDDTLDSLEGRDFGPRQALVAILSLLLVASFLLAGVWSAWAGMDQVRRGADPAIPAYLTDNEIDFDTATLIIDAQAGTWNLRSGGQTLWGQATFREGPMQSAPATAVLQQIVARAVAGRPDDTVTSQLGSLGVSSVLILHASEETVTALDATAGFQRATTAGDSAIWSITDAGQSPTRRALVNRGSPPVYLNADDEVPARSPRTLVLAIPPDPDLRVLVGGVELAPTTWGDWRAAYALGTATGPVQFQRVIEDEWVAWTQLAVVGLLVIFVLPPLRDPSVVADGPRHQLRGGR